MGKQAIELVDLTKKFGSFVANNKINLKINQGEVHAILGENGAGKSTLMNLLYGIHKPTSGIIKVNGEAVKINNPNDAKSYKIGMVHQHFKLIRPFTIAENIALSNSESTKFLINLKDNEQKIQEISDRYNFLINPKAKISDLTVGEEQKVEIIKMLYNDADILIFDEPTGALIPSEIDELMKIILDLKKAGKTIIIITHKLQEIKKVADNCSIIRHGEYIGTIPVADATEEDIAEMMVGRKINFKVNKSHTTPGKSILELSNIIIKKDSKNIVDNVSFKVSAGEIVGIAGVDGNGQSELVKGITGILKIKSGKITLDNNDITKKSIRSKTQLGIAHIPEDRQKYGLVLDYTIAENSALQEYYRKPFSKRGLINHNFFEQHGQDLIQKYDIRSYDGSKSEARALSGGNQQKVIIGREMERKPKLLIAVQPTRGLDVGAIEYIHQEIVSIRDNNQAVLLVSLELDEILKLSDRILVMHDGAIAGEVQSDDENALQKIGMFMAGQKNLEGLSENIK